MEAFYLLATILSNFLKSFTLSLLLLFRTLLPRHWSLRSSSNSSESVSLYKGIVWHERRHPVHHSLWYPVRYALYNHDHAPPQPPLHRSSLPNCYHQWTSVCIYSSVTLHVKLSLFLFLLVTLFWGLSLNFIYKLCHMLMCKSVNLLFIPKKKKSVNLFFCYNFLLTIPP